MSGVAQAMMQKEKEVSVMVRRTCVGSDVCVCVCVLVGRYEAADGIATGPAPAGPAQRHRVNSHSPFATNYNSYIIE